MIPTIQQIHGHALEELAKLPANSVHCCVTSPPYWGLRDYGIPPVTWPEVTFVPMAGLPPITIPAEDAVHGLEADLWHYVAHDVAIFRAVRRVLREDGTLWLNLGSTYAGAGYSNNENTGGATQAQGGKQKHSYVSRGKPPSQSRCDAPACDTGGKELQYSTVIDFSCSDLCDGCRAALSRRNDCNVQPPLQSPSLLGKTCHDSGHSDCDSGVPDASPQPAQGSTMQKSSPQPQANCRHCANCGACLSVLRSSSRDGRLCARKAQCNYDTSLRGLGSRNQGKDVLAMACNNLSTPSLNFKSKDLIPIPWMVALALQADGWYLRCDIIWHKPNPMPESVTDRPTKAHEYVFLLAKNERYFYDAEAVKESSVDMAGWQSRMKYKLSGRDPSDVVCPGDKEGQRYAPKGFREVPENGAGRNRRSVWTIPSQAYPESHFAVFPEALVKPCILAGTSARGCCPKCGAPWKRVVEKTGQIPGRERNVGGRNDGFARPAQWKNGQNPTDTKTLGWEPTCFCYCRCDDERLSSEHASQRQRSRKAMASGVEQKTMGRSSSPGQNRSDPEQAQGCLPEMWEGKAIQEGKEVLQRQLRSKMDVGKSFGEPIYQGCDGQVPAREPKRSENSGASGGDGESLGQEAQPLGDGSPSQRNKRRQSNRESCSADNSDPCQDPHEQATGHKLDPYQPIPCTVLDPFAGSFTTCQVSSELGRNSIGIDINPDYIQLGKMRCDVTPGLPI